MFTGIVEEIGAVERIVRQGSRMQIDIRTQLAEKLKIGDSVSVEGACLTVTKIGNSIISFDVVGETVKNSTLERLRAKDKVNLERAVVAGGSFGGHFVTGHVDGVGTIAIKRSRGEEREYTFSLPDKLSKYLVKKGSIAVDGISFTIADIRRNTVKIAVIPHTEKATTLSFKKVGSKVNIETDILAKYVKNHV